MMIKPISKLINPNPTLEEEIGDLLFTISIQPLEEKDISFKFIPHEDARMNGVIITVDNISCFIRTSKNVDEYILESLFKRIKFELRHARLLSIAEVLQIFEERFEKFDDGLGLTIVVANEQQAKTARKRFPCARIKIVKLQPLCHSMDDLPRYVPMEDYD